MPSQDNHPRLFFRRPSPLRPINYDWLSAAAALPGRTAHVACAIWYVASLQRSPTIRLSPYAVKRFGISRDCCYPALRRLEEAALITLDAGRGRIPVITLIDRQAQALAVI
jgi:hypothetical protein